MNPYIFIVGCPRSGTTVLQRMVDANPEVAITRQSRFIPKYYEKRTGLTPDGEATPGLVDELLSYPPFENMGLGREDLESLLGSNEPVPYASFVTGIFDLYGKHAGKRLVGDKTPAYVRSIPTLHALWPEAKFVHLIRDGRDVALSARAWKGAAGLAQRYRTWNEDPATTAAVWWEWNVRAGREAGNSLATGLYHEVRYEELVSEPAGICEELCGFLDVPVDSAMLRFHEGREKQDPNLDAKKAWRPLTSGLRKWSEQMSAGEVEFFEAAAGNLLDELGYPRAVPDPSAEALARASHVREAFAGDVPSSWGQQPVGWKR